MMKVKKNLLLMFSTFLLLMLVACTSDTSSEEDNQEKAQGDEELKVALQGIPPSLDPHITGSTMTIEISRPIFETLVSYDSNHEPQPMLAESWEISEDQKEIHFKLREGVTFHNGKEMTAEDVVASMNRWSELHATSARILGEFTFESVDEYEVVMKLEEPSFVALNILAIPPQFPAIMPKEVVEGAEATGVTEYIGTGPFKMIEYVSDQFIEYEKFDEYTFAEGEQDGLAGKKEALVDTLRIDFVMDDSTRVSSLLTGEYQIANALPYDNFDQLEGDEEIEVNKYEAGTDYIVFNKKQGIFSNQAARQGVLAGLDNVSLSIGVYSGEEFFDLNPSLSLEEQVNWYNKEGAELYNQNDPEKSKKLLEESGYNGEEITILTSDVFTHHNTAIGLQQQLESLGMKAHIESFEFATALEYRNDPANWDIYIVDLGTETLPINYLFFNPDWAGWTDSPEIQEAVNAIKYAEDQEAATTAAVDLQKAFYDYVPVLKPSNRTVLNATRDVDGLTNFANANNFWGISYK